MANRTKRTPSKKDKFLKSLSTGVPNVSKACKAAAIGRTLAYQWKREDPEFAQQWEDAIENAVDNLEQSAWQRAQRQKDPSDTLLIFLLKGYRSERFKDKAHVEHAGKVDISNAKNELGELLTGAEVPSPTK